MYANTCWGLLGLAVTFSLAMLGLPQGYEWLAPWFAGIAIACGVSSAICFAWPLRKKENRAKCRELCEHPARAIRLIEPIHIIVLGLLVALAGVAWQMKKAPQPNYAVYAPDPPKAPTTPPQISGTLRFYSTSDKERISEAFYKLSEILNKPVAHIESNSQWLINWWDGLKMNPDRRAELKQLLQQLEALRKESGDVQGQIGALQKDYRAYADLLQTVAPMPVVEREKPVSRWQYAANDFFNAVSTYERIYVDVDPRTREDLAKMADPTKDIFRDATAKLNGWINETNQRIESQKSTILKLQ